MFYSHQLLARKAPLGQIWMAATMHAKINRRKLDKLNIIKICEEILNPSVPMALRLSGILMGGVVIVFERKVKLLYDDVTRLLVEINEAWKVKSVPDPTLLPKAKSQAKKEAVTLPENQDTDVGEVEQMLNSSNTTAAMGYQQTAFFSMRLDSVDETFINDNARDEDQSERFHQAEPENITLFERFDPYQDDATLYNRYERFDVEGDDGTQPNFTSGEHTQIPTTLIPSPPPQDVPERAFETHNENPEYHVDQNDEHKEVEQIQQKERPRGRKRGRAAASFMDYEQTIVPGHVYQSWLQNTSDIVSKRGRGRNRKRTGLVSTMKIAYLMEVPPIVLIDDLFTTGNREVYYPRPLMEMWIKSTQPPHDSPSERTSPPLPPEASISSPPVKLNYQDPMHFEDFQSGVGSPSQVSVERQRANFEDTVTLMDELRAKHMKNGSGITETNIMLSPRYSGDDARSIPSGEGIPSNSLEVNSGGSYKKRPYSSSRHGSGGLEPVAEENPWHQPVPNFKLPRLSEDNGLTLDQEQLVETGPTQTQTQQPMINHPVDKITDSIRMQMKAHFDTPGAPHVESLNHLAVGMNRKGAALLFYQTCVLATRDVLRVEQQAPYGEIFISKGAKM